MGEIILQNADAEWIILYLPNCLESSLLET
jgi:hypothetical protein